MRIRKFAIFNKQKVIGAAEIPAPSNLRTTLFIKPIAITPVSVGERVIKPIAITQVSVDERVIKLFANTLTSFDARVL